MSWSIACIGHPEAVAAALDEYGAKLTDQSKAEFDAALPMLKGLVLQNFVPPDNANGQPTIDFEASGHGVAINGVDRDRSCRVLIQPSWKRILT